MKKFLIALSVLAATISVFAATTAFATEQGETFTVNEIIYEVTSKGETNEVAVKDHTINMPAEVVIPDKVTDPDDETKYDVTAVKSLAFGGGSNPTGHDLTLKSIELPDSVKTLGSDTFAFNDYTESQRNAALVIGQMYMYQYGFNDMTKLDTKSLCGGVFADCDKLEYVKLPANLESTGAFTFYGCDMLTHIDLPSSLKTIDTGAFKNSGLVMIDVPASVTTINPASFADCPNLVDAFFREAEETEVTISSSAYVDNTSWSVGSVMGCLATDGRTSGARIYTDNTSIKTYFTTNKDGVRGTVMPLETTGKEDAAKVYVELRETKSEGSEEYEVVLYPSDTEEIVKGFADIEFVFINSMKEHTSIMPEFTPAEGFGFSRININTVTDSDTNDVYRTSDCVVYVRPTDESRYDEGAGVIQIPRTGLVIGTVVLSGHGQGSLYIANATANKDSYDGHNIATALEVDQLINNRTPVTVVVPDGSGGTTTYNVNAMDAYDIAESTANLTIDLFFPNDIELGTDNTYFCRENGYAMFDVTITGNMGTEWHVGSNSSTQSIVPHVEEYTALDGETKYTHVAYQFHDMPANHHQYTIKIEGDGYRTAERTIILNGETHLYFWNNALEYSAMEVDGSTHENGTKSNQAADKEASNFLAGDIAMDGFIGLYDLNGVTSFYGQEGLRNDVNKTVAEGKDVYVQYDLNRDGKIDAKDIAYVLVSWGK